MKRNKGKARAGICWRCGARAYMPSAYNCERCLLWFNDRNYARLIKLKPPPGES